MEVINNDELVENLNSIQDLSLIVNKAINENKSNKQINSEQSGGFAATNFFPGIGGFIGGIITGILLFLKNLAEELFNPIPWERSDRGLFWKYLLFCIKCGFYLVIFAIAGPIFVVIGIVMIYSRLLDKMGIDGVELIRDRLSSSSVA